MKTRTEIIKDKIREFRDEKSSYAYDKFCPFIEDNRHIKLIAKCSYCTEIFGMFPPRPDNYFPAIKGKPCPCEIYGIEWVSRKVKEFMGEL